MSKSCLLLYLMTPHNRILQEPQTIYYYFSPAKRWSVIFRLTPH
jgi:hypothetical protein